MTAFIIANGELNDPEFARTALLNADHILACDGGLKHCHTLGVTPNCIIGDLDSVDKNLLSNYPDVPIIKFPTDKDQTDLELSLNHACSLGASTVIVLAGLGGRIDHQLGNIHALVQAVKQDIKAEIWDEHTKISIINNFCRLHKKDGEIVSLLPLSTTVCGITTSGLKYSLDDECLNVGYARGVSNCIVGEYAEINLKSGFLVVVQTSD